MEPPPAKRPRRATVVSRKAPVWGPAVVVRLLDEDSSNLGLSDPIVMQFNRLDYLTFNSTRVSYLCIICAAIFDVDYEKITITHSPIVKNVESLDEDDDATRMAWPVLEDDDRISKGTYCIIFDTDAGEFNVCICLIALEPNLDLSKVNKKAKVLLKKRIDYTGEIVHNATPREYAGPNSSQQPTSVSCYPTSVSCYPTGVACYPIGIACYPTMPRFIKRIH